MCRVRVSLRVRVELGLMCVCAHTHMYIHMCSTLGCVKSPGARVCLWRECACVCMQGSVVCEPVHLRVSTCTFFLIAAKLSSHLSPHEDEGLAEEASS